MAYDLIEIAEKLQKHLCGKKASLSSAYIFTTAVIV